MAVKCIDVLDLGLDALMLACEYIADMDGGCPLVMLVNPRCKECARSFGDVSSCWWQYFMAKAKQVRDG